MERLTTWNDKTEGAELISWNEEEWKDFIGSLDVPICTELSRAVEKLAQYEDAEEQGLLLRLPCKVGDTVYCFTPFCEICEETLDNEFSCEDCNKGSFVSENKFDYEMIRMFGRSIFRTKEEAEQALERMEKENG